MSDDSHWETTVHSQGVSIDAPELNNLIDLEAERLNYLRDEQHQDLTRSPPQADPVMFPGLLREVIDACCTNNEAVPVAVAINTLVRLSSLIGPTVYLQIGDERRLLNEFVLMIGPTGLGKGASNHGPKRIFKQVEQFLELNFQLQLQAGKGNGVGCYPLLKVHTGGLSSGEGLAAALDDGNADDTRSRQITDKRMLAFEPEFANVMNMCQRSGNILSMVLRNAFDGSDIKPLTKRDKVQVTNPYLCLIANITAGELASHEQSATMSNNGMLNRFLILWQQPVCEVPFPDPMDNDKTDQLAQKLSECILIARNKNHDTHYKKMPAAARAIKLDKGAIQYWTTHYGRLLNRPDCDQVMLLTRRHRLHAMLIASLLAILDHRLEIGVRDLTSALAWCEYSRRSVIYAFNSLQEQNVAIRRHNLSSQLLNAIRDATQNNKPCTASDLYKWFHGKLKREDLSGALEYLLNHIPPLITQRTKQSGPGRPSLIYRLANHGTTGSAQ